MQTLNLLNEAIGTIDEAQNIINDFHWFMTVDETSGIWTIKAGEEIAFTSDSREAVDAFLYGMALAYKGLPAHLYAKLFGLMAGIDIASQSNTIDIDLATEDDERLDDLNMNELENIDLAPDETIFPE